MFKKLDKTALPPRQWSLVGYPGSGKTTFAAQMRGPILPIDADHRFAEVARLTDSEVLELSDRPEDHVNAERITKLLADNMPGSDVGTIVVDSLTAILTPLVVQAILDNDNGRNKNRVSAFKPKAMAARLLQDAITGYGVDTLWVYHLRDGLDGQARHIETTTVSVVELARLRRSLNMQLRIVQEKDRRGVKVEWARCGRDGMTLWDDTSCWRGMPERIEQAVYGGLSKDDMANIAKQSPTDFSGPEEAIAWGYEQGAFRDAVHAKNAYDKLKTERKPTTAAEMWKIWQKDVQERVKAAAESVN